MIENWIIHLINGGIIGLLLCSWLKHNGHRFRKCKKCKKWIGLFNHSYCGVVHIDGSITTLHMKCLEGDNIRNYMKNEWTES